MPNWFRAQIQWTNELRKNKISMVLRTHHTPAYSRRYKVNYISCIEKNILDNNNFLIRVSGQYVQCHQHPFYVCDE